MLLQTAAVQRNRGNFDFGRRRHFARLYHPFLPADISLWLRPDLFGDPRNLKKIAVSCEKGDHYANCSCQSAENTPRDFKSHV